MAKTETDQWQHLEDIKLQHDEALCRNEAFTSAEAQLCRDKISEAEMVLVGLGEEFDCNGLQKCPQYGAGMESLNAMGLGMLIPAWNGFCSGKCTEKQGKGTAGKALERLRVLLESKNYFVVSTSTSNEIYRTAWRTGRLVMPCGAAVKKQCVKGCAEVLEEITREEDSGLRAYFENLYAGQPADKIPCLLGKCPVCGSDMVLNNIYAEGYNENGYLEQWQLYKKWLQGTVNKKLLILELGVGMRFPTVIRWPFEKAAYFNNKAYFYRVNKKIYQLTEELSGKGSGISQNAIDWLCGL